MMMHGVKFLSENFRLENGSFIPGFRKSLIGQKKLAQMNFPAMKKIVKRQKTASNGLISKNGKEPS
jgi:FKBP-type peptidyl-prolyl cis-trans isomerase (trigger factor)